MADVIYEPEEWANAIDLGNDHKLKFVGWYPDRDLNPHLAHLPDIEKCGCMILHRKPDGSYCQGFINFDLPGTEHLAPDSHRWKVECWEPLALSPSVLCMTCGDHGFVRNGKWVKA